MRSSSPRLAPARRARIAPRAARRGGLGSILGFVLVLVIALASGCASTPRYTVQISALSGEAEPPAAATYLLLPADPDKDPRDLQFREFAETVERGLAARGFVSTRDPAEATIALLLDYGVGDQRVESITHVRPALSYYNGVGFGRGLGHRHGPGCRHGYRGLGVGFYDPFYLDPPTTRTFTTFSRYFAVEARRIEADRPPRDGEPIWATRVESRGRETDLRAVFPALVAAAADYLGTDTGAAIETRISGDDERVQRLRDATAASGSQETPTRR